MKWLKKWAYLILFVGTGIVYFAFVDHWQVYAGPLGQVQDWYKGMQEGSKGAGDARSALEAVLEGTEASGGFLGGMDLSAKLPPASEGPEGTVPEEGDGQGSPGDKGGQSGMEGDGGPGAGEATGGSGQEGGDGAGQSSPEGSGGSSQNGLEGGSQESQEPKAVEYKEVEDDYFSDAVFIGDSRTVGMFEYGGLEEISTFYASKGLTVFKMFESQIVSAPGGKITIEEALGQNQFAKIYLMIGINEMGTGTVETFLEKYKEVVERLKELQPEAVIYLQGIMKVTSERSAKGDYINNEGIDARNEGIALLADDERVFYLDVNPLVCDESGGLNPDYTYDGVHLKGKDIQIWKDYLKAHAICP